MALAEGGRAFIAKPWPCGVAGTTEPAGWPQLGELQSLSGGADGVEPCPIHLTSWPCDRLVALFLCLQYTSTGSL